MIEPGTGSDDFKIGMSFDEIKLLQLEFFEIEDRDIFRVYKTESIWFLILNKTNKLDQLSFFYPFDEKVLGKVGIGDPLSYVHKYFGKCAVNHRVYEPIKYPGIAFETKLSSKSKNAVIESISVSDPYAFYGEVRI